MANSLKAYSDTEGTQAFRETADKICNVAERYGIKIRGYVSADLPLFSALAPVKKAEVLELLRQYLRSMENTEEFGDRLDDCTRAVWGALSTMGLVPSGDLFSHLVPGSAIEIYDLNGMQIWRNLTCMKFCSYTLEEVFSIEVFSRYKRDPERAAECVEKVNNLLEGKTPQIYYPNISSHLLEEVCSEDRLVLDVRHVLFSTLRNREGEVRAWLVMSGAEIVGSNSRQALAPKLSIASEPSAFSH